MQIKVKSVNPLLDALNTAGVVLFLPLEEKRYCRGSEEIGHRQFIVADPDGYLLRFCEIIDSKNFQKNP